MNVNRWIARREPHWKRLRTLLDRVEKQGLTPLTSDEIHELASLYRSVSADLARAQTHDLGHVLIKDLQQLTSRSYSQIYMGSRRQEWQGMIEFYQWRLPTVMQQTWPYIATATAIFGLGALIAWWYAWTDPSFVSLIAPPELISMVRDEQKLWMGSILGVEPVASSNIMINNIRVSFNAVAGGITAGILTIYIMFFNGIHIGGIATLVGQNKLAYPFWAFVFPHGSLELPAIFLAGGAGLLIAKALLFPRPYRRIDAFKIYGFQAAQLIFGIIPMLIIAGIIEGFYSPSPLIPAPIKYLTGIILFTLLILYGTQRKIKIKEN
ncbi:MAG: stage II sporulation protein M [Microcystaceae cyanobacterium]